MTVTLYNAKELLRDRANNPIGLCPVYPEQKRKFFYLSKELSVQLSTGNTITMPVGFTTDLSSVPRFLWSIEAPFGNFLLAALIHDFLYVHNIGTRKEADREMFIWSNVVNENQVDNFLRYLAVRAFGKSWWDT